MNRAVLISLKVAALFAAAFVGGAVSVAFSQRGGPAETQAGARPGVPRTPTTYAAKTAHEDSSALTLGIAQKLGELETRIDELDRPQQPGSTENPDWVEPSPPPAEFYHERHAETIRRHRSESVDPAWGPTASKLIHEDISKLAETSGFQLLEVECRSESCRAVARWDSFRTASAKYKDLLVASLRASCARSIVVPETPENAPAEATLVLDCAEWKTTGSAPLLVQ